MNITTTVSQSTYVGSTLDTHPQWGWARDDHLYLKVGDPYI